MTFAHDADALWREAVEGVGAGWTCAEATLHALLRAADLDTAPVGWAAAGYRGAICSGRTICGALYGATVFLGVLWGACADGGDAAPDAPGRPAAVDDVSALFAGFLDAFGATECATLTGVDLGDPDARAAFLSRYYAAGLDHPCNQQISWAIRFCLERLAAP